MNARELRRILELDGYEKTATHINEALDQGHLKPDDFSLRDLAESLVENGREFVQRLNPQGGYSVMEATDGVDVTAFANITGQIIYSKIREAYESEAFVLSRLVDTIPTKFDGEKIPTITGIDEDASVVQPGMPFPEAGISEDYIETPSTTKRGLIVSVTKEAIFFDRTSMVLRQAGTVGERLGINKEKRLCDVVAGFTNPFSWNGTTYNTYQTATPWINKKAANDLIDWTDIDAAEQLFADMLDPHTSEPILINPARMTLVATPARMHAAKRVVHATDIEVVDNQASAGTTRTRAKNTVDNYRLEFSRQLYRRLIANSVSASNASQYWWLGDFKKAFAYMQNWPLNVRRARENATADFEQDIVARFRADERGAAAVLDPRYVVMSTS